MRLLFIHGIGQQAYDEPRLLAKWSKILTDHGFDPAKLAAAQPQMAFYGDLLHQLSKDLVGAQPMSASVSELSGMDAGELEFIQEALAETAEQRGFTSPEIEAAAQRAQATLDPVVTAIPMSTGLGRFAVGVLRLLDELAPPLRDTALRVLKQAYAYLKKPGVRPTVDDRVRPKLETGKLVLVTHSLGSVVAFHLLRELAKDGYDLKVPLLISMGSPLGVEAVKRYVDLPHRVPTNVGRWLNFYDRGDPVSLGKSLAGDYSSGIVDNGTINNQTDNAHGIEGYLNQSAIRDAIAAAL
ncbi:hypothetical protein CHU93_00135 [Sandarakinorhabdus cyanobacteriorum]|uniref:Alpha/beta hydrolase n=1 Tax=Sandarakinorhabdus cyanobacteriorum TaxID=1981098 RepID=A0A255Z9D9_9SPHN|nr:hypothetical protein [Sandarakinorhabdus cyanobacteriorum]OYQ38042.1 hypothetical protein CHU93_00135 [Sandarakinorhabdus cyanobacteriorum]